MNLEDIPTVEELLPLFDPRVVQEVNARIGHESSLAPRRIDTLSGFEGQPSPYGASPETERPDWATGFAANARMNIFSRGFWLLNRSIDAGLNTGTQRIYDGDAREFTTKIDVDKWIDDNAKQLRETPVGQRVLRNYHAGYYDDIDDAGYFLTLVGYDEETGRQKEIADNAGLTAKLAGAALDPTIFAGGAVLRIGAGTALRLRAGLALGEAYTATRAASTLALNGRLGAYIGENIKIGLGANIVNEIGQRTVGPNALERTLADTAIDAVTGLIADSVLSAAFFGLGRASRAVGLSKPLDISELQARSGKAAKKAVADTESQSGSLWDLVMEAVNAPPVPVYRLGGKDEAMSSLDDLFVARQQVSDEVAELKTVVRGLQDNQLRLFDDIDVESTSFVEGAGVISEQELARIRLNQAQSRLKELDKQIRNSAEVVETEAAKGTVTVTRDESVAESVEGLFDRRQYATREEAIAAGYRGAGADDSGFLHEQASALSVAERNEIAAALADPTVIDSLRRVRDAISNAETAQAADFEGDLLNALNAIANRSPNLKWNPASLGIGTVQTVKIDQPILYSEVVAFVPTTPAEDILLALKKLGAFDQLEGGVAGVAPVRNGRPRSRPPASIPPTLGGRYAELSNASIADLSLDLTNDRIQAAVKAARAKLAELLNKQGLKADADDFTGVGLAGMASQLGTGLAYSTSRNRVTSSLYNTMFESPFISKIYTRADSGIPSSLRVPLERVAASIKKRVSQSEEQLLRSFKGFRNKRGKSQTAITPALMSGESRAELTAFYGMVEEIRLRGQGSPLDDAQLLKVVQSHFSDADASVLPLVKRAVNKLNEPLPTTGSGRLNGKEIHALRKNSTSVMMNTEVTLPQAIRILRRAQELGDVRELNEQTLKQTLKIFARMTDGEIAEITAADMKAAIANPNGEEAEFLKNRIVSLWNRRLNGVMNRQTALNLLEDSEFQGLIRLDSVQANRAYQQQAVRVEMLEKLTDYNLMLQRIEQGRGGQSATAETAFTELFARYEQLVKDFELARASAEQGQDVFGIVTVSDKIDRLLSDSIDVTTKYAARQSDRIRMPGDTPERRAKRFKTLEKEADKLNELLKSEAGFIYSGPSETTLGKIGDATAGLSRTSLLSRMGISMLADNNNIVSKAIAVGAAKHLPKSYLLGIAGALQKVPVEERPQLMSILTAFEDNALHNLSKSTDLGFTDVNRTTSQGSVSGLDKTVAAIENPISKAGFIASGGHLLDNALRQTATIQGLAELTDPNGLIRKLADALEKAETGEALVDSLRRAGLDGNMASYAQIMRYLSRDDIAVLKEAIDSGRYEISTSGGRIFDSEIRWLSPVDENASEAVKQAQSRATANLGHLLDSWVEFRSLTMPHTVDRPRARSDAQSFPMRMATKFMSSGLAAGRTAALQTGNDGLGRRAFYVTSAVAAAYAVLAARSIWKGDDERFIQEVQDEPWLVLADAVGWSGVAGILGDKALPTIATFFLGENAAYDSRRNLDFAITTPIQSYGSRAFAAFTGVRDLVTGEEPSDFERRAIRNVFSAGILDSTLTDGLLIGLDATNIDEMPVVEDVIDFLYTDLEDKEGIIKKKLNDK